MVYTPVIDDKPAEDIICSLHCVLVDVNVGVNEGTLDGDTVGALVGVTLCVNEGTLDGDTVGALVGVTLGNLEGDDVGMLVPVGSHSNTYLSYELKAILDTTTYSNSPLKGFELSHCLPICPVGTFGIFFTVVVTNVFIKTLFLYIVLVLVLVSYTVPYTLLSMQQVTGVETGLVIHPS